MTDLQPEEEEEEVEVICVDSTEEGKSSALRPKACKSTLMAASRILFALASTLYLWLGVLLLQHYKKIEVDEDDYVFQTPFSNVWVSQIMILYFSAALCFLLVGVCDLLYKRGRHFGIALLLAGLFGLAASMLVERDSKLSNIFSCISMHLFTVEAAELLFGRNKETVNKLTMIADVCFLTGSVMGVVLSYFLVTETFGVNHSKASICAACLWLMAALIYLYVYFLGTKSSRTSHEISSKVVLTNVDKEKPLATLKVIDLDAIYATPSEDSFDEDMSRSKAGPQSV